MRILVTGAAGYIGSVLCKKLMDAGYQVIALDNLMYGQNWSGFPASITETADVTKEDSFIPHIQYADAIVHLAAIVGAGACNNKPSLSERVNFLSVLTLAKYAGGKPIIFPNTNSGYGNQGVVDETSPLKPLSTYAKWKGEAEAVLLKSGAVSLRLATVFGVSRRMRLDLLVNDWVYKAVRDRYLVVFEKDFRRNFVHVNDVARAMIFSLENYGRMSGQVYNLGLDEANMTKEELAERIKKLTACYVHYAEFAKDPDKRDYLVSHQKLHDAGFECQSSLDDGIREVMEWSRKEVSPYRNI